MSHLNNLVIPLYNLNPLSVNIQFYFVENGEIIFYFIKRWYFLAFPSLNLQKNTIFADINYQL